MLKSVIIRCQLILALFACFIQSYGQRTYADNSVLASGNWYEISVPAAGVYRMDIAFLASLGIPVSGGLSSGTIRLFGNGGGMLPEANNSPRPDDLQELAIKVVDGGDGILNGSDYILFYSPGPDEWIPKPATESFDYQQNLYSRQVYYYLSVGGSGNRITAYADPGTPAITVTSFSERIAHESDLVNFLRSGKEWFGEEFADAPGKSLVRTFEFGVPDIISNEPLSISTHMLSRSSGSPGRFQFAVNGQSLPSLAIPTTAGGIYDLFARKGDLQSAVPSASSTSEISVEIRYVPGSFNAQGWLNQLLVFFRRSLVFTNNQLAFRDWQSLGNPTVEFQVSNASAGITVWDVTEQESPVEMQGTLAGNQFRFRNNASQLREYIAFNPSLAPPPDAGTAVPNQNLHGEGAADYLIVSAPSLIQQAERLADFHRQRGLRVLVASTDQVYREFSSGIPDPVAIRDFVKMFYDRYGSSMLDRPRYLLLFGDASYDYLDRLPGNNSLVPGWQSDNSLDPLNTYVTDDFFGFLDDNEDIGSGLVTNLLDIGIGRIPARDAADAKSYVDKVIAYHAPESLGPWRNNMLFIADDEDFNLHLNDAELLAARAEQEDSVINLHKVYLDAYVQETGAGGSRYPKAREAITNHIYNGILIWNYTGHGGPVRLAEENVLDFSIVESWRNPDKLPLFITATCDFAPYDNPLLQSLGEYLLLRERSGGIALMTTTRVVFAFSNRVMNEHYISFALDPKPDGTYRTLGEAVMDAKNFNYQTSADQTNNRKFTLLGDPALMLGFPQHSARIDALNGLATDTLSSTELVTVDGSVTDQNGSLLSQFNGIVYPVLFDKEQTVTTLANDPNSQQTEFQTLSSPLFRGKATVTNGRFRFSFRMPKDINYSFGEGRLSLYAENGQTDASGVWTDFIVGGAGSQQPDDEEGPEIKAYLNDERFVNGGITNEEPILILNLSDSSGINTAGAGIGHDLVATLDGDNRNYFILNDFFENDLDSYQSGKVRFQLPALEPGSHTLKIKAWDVLNNSSEYELAFNVVADGELVLSHVLNYPNPFTTQTSFWFEHNRPGQQLHAQVQIFTVSGKLIKTISKAINTTGNRSSDVEWDGRDHWGDRIGRGVYVYILTVTDESGKKARKTGKLAIF